MNETIAEPGWLQFLVEFEEWYYPPIIIIIGVTGNVLMFLLMSSREFKQTPSSIYMRAISVTDSVYLIFRVGQLMLGSYIPSLKQGASQKPFCLEYYITFSFGQSASLLILVAMSLSRTYAILYPMKAIQGNTLKRAKIHCGIACGLAFGYSLCFNLSRSLIPELAQQGWSCPFYFYPPYDEILTHVESALGYSCLLVILLTNILIVYTVVQSRNKRTEMQGKQKQQTNDDDNSMLIMLLLVSTLYLIAYMMPRMKNAYYFANEAVTPAERHTSKAISIITVLIEHGNFALNFYLVCLPLPKFRNAVLKMLRIRKKSTAENSVTSVNTSA